MKDLSMASTHNASSSFKNLLMASSLLSPIYVQAQAAAVRVPLSKAAVAQTLQSAGIPVQEKQITLPFEVATESAKPTLLVSGLEALASARLRVRLACGDPHDCLPFFAIVQCADDSAAKIAASTHIGSSSEPTLPIKTSAPALRPGDHAMLLLEDSQMQISLPVLSIDGGKLGSTVRVSSLDRKQTYVATVVDAQVVRGTLP